ncbi:MAG: DUF3971 domain-containing protein, partial [Quisquiliibacterium sp.]
AGRLTDAQFRLQGEELRWRHDTRELGLAGLRIDASARRDLEGLALRVEQFELALRPGLQVASVGPQEILLDGHWRAVSGRVSVGRFDAGALLGYLRGLPLPESLIAQLAPVAVSGEVSGLNARWSEGSLDTLEASIDFVGLSLAYRKSGEVGSGLIEPGGNKEGELANLPWFERLDGEARIFRDSGDLRLRSKGGALGFPGIFAQPVIGLDTLNAKARWKIERSGPSPVLEVQVERLAFANADCAGEVSGTYRTGGKGPGIVALTGKLNRAKADRVGRYLPVQIDSVVRRWVDESIGSGIAEDVRFTLRGDLKDFPYRDPGSGEFAIVARVRGVGLRYAPGWPKIDKVEGVLAFERAGMRIQAKSAQVFRTRLAGVRASIADFSLPLLRIEGNGTGPAADMLRFVNQSPVASRIDDFSRDASATGEAKLSLRLALPLNDLAHSRVAGRVDFNRNELRLGAALPVFTGVRGSLEFTEDKLALRDISATFLGGSVRVNGQTPQPGRLELHAEGSASAQGMRQVADNPLTRALGGQTNYKARIDLRGLASTLTIESDLRGLHSNLPHPFRKAADEAWPLKVTATPELPKDPAARTTRDQIRVVLRDKIRLVLERERVAGAEKLVVRRAALAMNAEPVLQ